MRARTGARALGTKRRESYGGNYSAVKSAQRLSATLSIRPRGRVEIIDMLRGGILVSKHLRVGSVNLQALCDLRALVIEVAIVRVPLAVEPKSSGLRPIRVRPP